MKSARNISIITFMFAAFALGVTQMVIFHQYAFEASYLYARQMLGVASAENQSRLGNICSSIGRTQCALKMFQHLQELRPNNLEDMANLAVVLTNAEKVAEAMPYYQAYIAGGGASDRVIRWYAYALAQTGAPEQSIPWYYRALANNMHDRELAAEFLATLKKAGRSDEAMSLREQMSELGHFSAIGLKDEPAPRDIASVKDDPDTKKEYSFPSLDGRNFYLPFHFRDDKSEFIVADPDRKHSVINEVDLARWGLAPRVNGAGRVMIRELKVGSLTIRNAEMDICDECKTVLGADILAKAAGRVDTRNKIALLILTDGE